MKRNNVDLICSVGELAGLFEKGTNLHGFLNQVVSVVAWHMKAAVCSVYLYDERKRELVLVANQGLNPDIVGKLRLQLGEGIVGQSLKELRPIREAEGSANPNFKYIPGSFEERYEAFLAVPIVRGLSRVGVLVVEDAQKDYFDENDTKALKAIAAQLASTIENAKLLIDLHESQHLAKAGEANKTTDLSLIKGISASHGFAYAAATTIGHLQNELELAKEESLPPKTAEDFKKALEDTEKQIQDVQRQMEERMADVASLIFSAHLLMLKDESFSGDMLRHIEEGVTPQAAILRVVDRYTRFFSGNENPRLREKAQDVKDLGHRLLHNLRHEPDSSPDYSGQIVIARELLPSDMFKLVGQRVAGLILVGSGVSSHVSILARSLQIPTVIANESALLELPEKTPILLDAYHGNIFIQPAPEVVKRFQETEEAAQHAERMESGVKPETWTADGCRIRLLANINLLADLSAALRLKAEGVGLYRSEFPFIVRNDFPSEEEQFRVYRTLLEKMGGKPVVFRTLDIGGDKMLSYFPNVNEANPFLGLRAIRFSFRNKDIFSQQLRALLRAGEGHALKIMFPLVSSVDDFIQAKDIVRECAVSLEQEKTPHNGSPELGIMIEMPSAIEVVEELAAEADFMSIGSNDLIQYMLAVDRTNAHVSDLYVSHHPAVLRALKRTAHAARRFGKPVSLCGDMAHDRRMLPFLIGIGLREFSLDAGMIPTVQSIIQTIDTGKAAAWAEAILKKGKISEIEEFFKTDA